MTDEMSAKALMHSGTQFRHGKKTLCTDRNRPSFPNRQHHAMWRVKDLLVLNGGKEQGGSTTSDSCVPDRQWMARVHLDAAALDQHDVYIFTSQWVPSIPPSPW